MFCSWKTGPNAPCGCAFRLRSPVHELLNHLCFLGEGTLILRRPGLSLAKSTPFGLHISERNSGWHTLRDAISGLETDTAGSQDAYLLREASDSCPLFAMGPAGKPIEFTVRLTGHKWQSPALQQMLRRFNSAALDCLQSRQLGAGAWLDEWERPLPTPSAITNELVLRSSDALHDCDSLEVEIRTTSHRNNICFRPSFIDSEGTVLRIADKQRTHVVYADVSTPDFQLTSRGSRELRLTHL